MQIFVKKLHAHVATQRFDSGRAQDLRRGRIRRLFTRDVTQIFVKTLVSSPICSKVMQVLTQIFVKTLLCLLITSRHDVSMLGERGRCLKPLQIFVKTSVR